ncbi:hypothetical protein A5881_001223 [Enterococcus termitis]|nr:hypothetical protein A5881_003045 [Enterococcus termitis]
MSFTMNHLEPETITGKQYTMKIPQTPEEFSAANRRKQEILPKNQDSVRALIINDPTLKEGSAYYFVEEHNGEDTFTIPAGDYAVFVGPWETLADIDHFIGASYGELYQSAAYGIGGTYNIQLIDFQNSKITLQLPAIKN